MWKKSHNEISPETCVNFIKLKILISDNFLALVALGGMYPYRTNIFTHFIPPPLFHMYQILFKACSVLRKVPFHFSYAGIYAHKKLHSTDIEQECIPVGCVPSAAVAVGGGVSTSPPVNRITDACKNITLPQLRCGR